MFRCGCFCFWNLSIGDEWSWFVLIRRSVFLDLRPCGSVPLSPTPSLLPVDLPLSPIANPVARIEGNCCSPTPSLLPVDLPLSPIAYPHCIHTLDDLSLSAEHLQDLLMRRYLIFGVSDVEICDLGLFRCGDLAHTRRSSLLAPRFQNSFTDGELD